MDYHSLIIITEILSHLSTIEEELLKNIKNLQVMILQQEEFNYNSKKIANN